MSCLNTNVFYLQEGKLRELPTHVSNLARVYDIISTVWKAKVISISPCSWHFAQMM